MIITVGQDVIMPPLVRLIINCSDLINTVSLWNITWTKNDRSIMNGSEFEAFISQDNKSLILNNPRPNSGGEVRSEGDYQCRVCTNDGICTKKKTTFDICGKISNYCRWIIKCCTNVSFRGSKVK